MAKGTYTLNEGSNAPSSKDASYKSCLCALLVFITICIIILVVGMKWKKYPVKEQEKGDDVNFQELNGSTKPAKRISSTISTASTAKIFTSTTFAVPPRTKDISTDPVIISKSTSTASVTPTSEIITKLPSAVTPKNKTSIKTTFSSPDVFSGTTTANVMNTPTTIFNETNVSVHKFKNHTTTSSSTQSTEKNIIYDHTGKSYTSNEKATEAFNTVIHSTKTTSTDTANLFTAKPTNPNRTDQVRSTTERLSVYNITEGVKAKKDENSTTSTTVAAKTDTTHLFFVQNSTSKFPMSSIKSSTAIVNPTDASITSTIFKQTLGVDDDWFKSEEEKSKTDDNMSKTTQATREFLFKNGTHLLYTQNSTQKPSTDPRPPSTIILNPTSESVTSAIPDENLGAHDNSNKSEEEANANTGILVVTTQTTREFLFKNDTRFLYTQNSTQQISSEPILPSTIILNPTSESVTSAIPEENLGAHDNSNKSEEEVNTNNGILAITTQATTEFLLKNDTRFLYTQNSTQQISSEPILPSTIILNSTSETVTSAISEENLGAHDNSNKSEEESTTNDDSLSEITQVTREFIFQNNTHILFTQNSTQKLSTRPILFSTVLLNPTGDTIISTTAEEKMRAHNDSNKSEEDKMHYDTLYETGTTLASREPFFKTNPTVGTVNTTSATILTTPSKRATSAQSNLVTTIAETTVPLVSETTSGEGVDMIFSTGLSNIILVTTQKTTLSTQADFNNRIISKTTLNGNENQLTTESANKTATKTYEDLGTNIDIRSAETTTESLGTANKVGTTTRNSITARVAIVNTTEPTNENRRDQTSSTTETIETLKMLEVVEVTQDESEEDASTEVTETNITPLIFLQNTTSTKLLNSLSKNITTTSTETTLKMHEDNPGKAVRTDENNLNFTTTVNTQTTEKSTITAKTPSWSEKMNTITNTILSPRKPEPVCYSVECKSAASRMLSFMDHSADACNDFYEFACGGMPAVNPDFDTWKRILEQMYLINASSPSYLRTFRAFYDSCLSYEHDFNYQERIEGVLKLVDEVGEILSEDIQNDTIDLTDLFAKLILRQSHPFMDIDTDIDDETSQFVLKLTPPRPTSVLTESGRWSALTEAQKRCLDEQGRELGQLNLDLTKIYESYRMCQKNHTIYLNSIETVAQALGFYSHLNNTLDKSQQIQDRKITSELDIFDYLNTFPSPDFVRETVLVKNYTILKISDLENQYQYLKWNRLFNKISGRTLEDNTTVHVYLSSYFDNIFKKLRNVDAWKLNNALIATYAHTLYENLVIPQAKYSRENYCIKLSSKLFHGVSSNLYTKSWPLTEIERFQAIATEMFNRLKQNLKSVLQTQEWLFNTFFLELKKMELTFNSYNKEPDLISKYSAITMTRDFQGNAMKMLENDRKMRYALIGEQCSTDNMWSYFVNAYDSTPTSFYSTSSTIIMAPLGMVRPPVKRVPEYITMARIGLSLAREIGRHVHPITTQRGRILSVQAQHFTNILKNAMEEQLLFKATKFVGKQSVTYMPDATLSMNERIADNTGFRLISDSLNTFSDQDVLPWVSTTYSREQIFHIIMAQEYCQNTDMPEFMLQLFESEVLPASLRVENIMTNSRQFSKAFSCARNSRMNKNRIKAQFPRLEI